jgi:hypothetical protein
MAVARNLLLLTYAPTYVLMYELCLESGRVIHFRADR